jgi:two-component system LytT family response regulator
MKERADLMRAYLVDDEPLALKRLNKLLAATESVQVLGKATEPNEAIAFLNSHDVDVLFLDIQMPQKNGFELLAKLRERPSVIFTTAYERYAVQAFEVNAIDYLLKPIAEDHLKRALSRVRQARDTSAKLGLRQQIDALASALANHWGRSEPSLADRITFRLGDKIVLEELVHITHFWAEDKVTFAATEQGTRYIADSSIADLERRLTPRGFIRIHRNTLVNLAFIAEFHRWFAGRMLVSLSDKNRTRLQVSRAQAKVLRRQLSL